MENIDQVITSYFITYKKVFVLSRVTQNEKKFTRYFSPFQYEFLRLPIEKEKKFKLLSQPYVKLEHLMK